MELIIYDEEKQIAKPSNEARQIEAFKKLITRDKGSKGDNDGRKKYQALKEFAYIRFMEHPLSPFKNTHKDERHAEIVKFLAADIAENDMEILTARGVYRKMLETSTVRTLNSIKEGLLTANKLIEKLSQEVEKILNKEDEPITLAEIKTANDLLDSLLDKANKVPKTIQTIESLEEKVKKEQSTRIRVKGEGDINPFEE